MDFTALIVQLVAGAIGGNAVGGFLKERSLGPAGNSLAGAVGGVIIGQVIQQMTGGAIAADTAAVVAANLDVASLIKDAVGGGIGGALLAAVAGVVVKH